MDNQKFERMQGAARRVLANYQSMGEPFCLFLSSWSFDQQRAAYLAILNDIGLSEYKGEVQVRIGLERQVRILLKQDGLETVAVFREGDQERIAQPDEWPSLSLTDEEWRAQVSKIVTQADLIVLFWGVLTTPGLLEEVEMCSSGTIPLKTVVVHPAAPREIWMSQVWQSFPRVVPLNEIPPMFALHPEFTPLIDRMKEIKKIDPPVRKGLIDQEERLRKFPLPPCSGRFDRNLWVEWQPPGDVAGALATQQAALTLSKKAAAVKPTNIELQLDLARNHERVSEALHSQGDLSGALENLIASRAIRERVAAISPSSEDAQDLAGANIKIGDILHAQGALSDAATEFHAALAIVQRLAAAEPNNLGLQRNIATAHNRVSYVYSAKGDFAGALAALEASLAVRTHIAEVDPANPQWKSELVITYEKIGDLWLRLGKPDSALRAYNVAVSILQRLTDIAPQHSISWQRDLADIQVKVEKSKQMQCS